MSASGLVIIPRPLAPARAAEIAEQTATKVERLGLCKSDLLFSPIRGTVSIRAAAGLTLGIPPQSDIMFSPLRRNDENVAELFEFERAFADFLALIDVDDCKCGAEHDNRIPQWENRSDVTTEVAVHELRRFRDAQVALAAYDASGAAATFDADWDAFARQLSDGGTEN